MTYPQQPSFAPPVQHQQPYQPPAPPQYQQGAAPGGFFQTQDPHLMTQQGPAVPPPSFSPAGAPEQTDTSSFWGGAAAISWDDRKGYVRGTYRGGRVLSKKIGYQTKMGTNEILTWNDGRKREQLVIQLATSERADPQDNGQRQLFVKGDMPRAVREAFQAVGAKDVEDGGWLYVAWVDERPAKQAGYNPAKVFKAVYAPPGSPDPAPSLPQPAPQAPPWQHPAEQVAPSVVNGVPQPHATPDQFAAYAAQQAAYAPPGPLAATPANVMAQHTQTDPAMAAAVGFPPPQQAAPPQVPADQAAQFAAWQAQQQAGQQAAAPPAQAPGYNPFA